VINSEHVTLVAIVSARKSNTDVMQSRTVTHV
jgi:hypothetical protein